MMTRIIDKLGWVVAALVSLAALAALAGFVTAGPLDPPGPVGSTDKTVITSLPFTISQPGSYVLKSNLTATGGGNGITVNANDVSIDLQGFELVGASLGSTAISSSQSSITVRNGTIRDWTGTGVLANADSVIDGLRLTGNGSGIALGARASISNCIVQGSTSGNGILAGLASIIDKCTVSLNAGLAISVGDDSVVRETVARGNGGTEILAGARALLEDCVADGNNTNGNGIEIGDASHVRACTATRNNGTEIYANNYALIEDCVVDGGTNATPPPFGGPGDGIRIYFNSVVRGCRVENNAQSGIFVNGRGNHLEGNFVFGNDGIGIYLYDFGNTGTMNRSGSNLGGNCFVSANNDFVTITSTINATNPWSNYC